MELRSLTPKKPLSMLASSFSKSSSSSSISTLPLRLRASTKGNVNSREVQLFPTQPHARSKTHFLSAGWAAGAPPKELSLPTTDIDLQMLKTEADAGNIHYNARFAKFVFGNDARVAKSGMQ
jgi:hypothetical protein